MNPYDEFAVEQALQVKQNISDSTVTVVRVGQLQTSEVLRTALAMGADDAVLVETKEILDSYMTAKAIKGAIDKTEKKPDLILMGKQAIDSDCLQVPQLLAELMDLPSVSVIVGFELSNDQLLLKREIDGGSLEVYNVDVPCVIACNKGLNTPRYASLPGIMKAKKKPLLTLSLEDVQVSESDRKIKYSNFHLPPEKPPGKTFETTDDNQLEVVKEVVQLLRDEAKVI